MGRAIVRDPHVFLFDEPLSNLDAKLRGQVRTVTLGIRHEAMVPEPMVRPMTEPFGLDADITLVQPLGGEALLFLQMGEAEVTTRASRPNARLVPSAASAS